MPRYLSILGLAAAACMTQACAEELDPIFQNPSGSNSTAPSTGPVVTPNGAAKTPESKNSSKPNPGPKAKKPGTKNNSNKSKNDPSCVAPKILCNGICVNPNTDRNYCGASDDCEAPKEGKICGMDEVCSMGTCAKECAAGEIRCNDECIDPKSNKDFCGATLDCQGNNKGSACAIGQVCDAGTCKSACGPDQIICSGECINPSDDKRFCGAKADCLGLNAGVACPTGLMCSAGTCKADCDPGLLKCGDLCINPLQDHRYCGAKLDCMGEANNGEQCPKGSICSKGKCSTQCDEGLVECGGKCIDPKTDNNFCGATDKCVGPTKCEDNQSCVDGVCRMDCPAGKIKCGTSCIDPKTNNRYCGASGSCLPPNDGSICSGDRQCVNGRCELSCAAGELQCGGSCINPKSDERYCGASDDCSGTKAGQTCDVATQECINGACRPKCEAGKIACGKSCIDPKTDQNYCGATDPCDEVHKGQPCNADQRCIAGVCKLDCAYPKVNCGGMCIDPKTSLSNCGAVGNCLEGNAGTECKGNQKCVAGKCAVQCEAGKVACGQECVDPKNDREYCGADANCQSGQSCGSDQICSAGVCQKTCPAGQVLCGDRCVDPKTDNKRCGASGSCDSEATWGKVCRQFEDESCVDGKCVLQCKAGKIACDGQCIDPQTNPKFCGATTDCSGSNRGKTCKTPEQSCVAGSCQDTGCGESEAKVRPDPVVIELVLDKSGSMVIDKWDGGSGKQETRWRSLHRAVMKLLADYGPSAANKRGKAEFGVLLFPDKYAGMPFGAGSERKCVDSGGNCASFTDPWASNDPRQQCTQSNGKQESCVMDSCQSAKGNEPEWRPQPAHGTEHFKPLIPTADAQLFNRHGYDPTSFTGVNRTKRNEFLFGGTPTIDAMGNAFAVLNRKEYLGRTKVAILISDGATSCATYGHSGASSSECRALRNKLLDQKLYTPISQARLANGIKTFVIGVDLRTSDTSNSSVYCDRQPINPHEEANLMAKAGGTTNALNVSDSAALQGAFENILKDVLSCTVNIKTKAPYPKDVHVHFPKKDGSKGPEVTARLDKSKCADIAGGAEGWIYPGGDQTKIELCNRACTDFKERLSGDLIVVKGCKGSE